MHFSRESERASERASCREKAKCWCRQIAGQTLSHEWQGELRLTHILLLSQSPTGHVRAPATTCLSSSRRRSSSCHASREPKEAPRRRRRRRRRSLAHIAISVQCFHEGTGGSHSCCTQQKTQQCPSRQLTQFIERSACCQQGDARVDKTTARIASWRRFYFLNYFKTSLSRFICNLPLCKLNHRASCSFHLITVYQDASFN